MDWSKLQQRYIRDEWPTRLGNLASTLGRVAQRAMSPKASEVIPLSIRESMFLIEWNLGRTPDEVILELAPMQRELGLWYRGWEMATQSSSLRRLLSYRARVMSDRVLELSGLLTQTVTG